MMELIRAILFLPEGASTFADRIDGLHMFVITVSMLAAAGTGAASLAFFVRYRRRSENQLSPRVHPPFLLEVAFVSVPLAFFLLWFAIGFRDFVHMNTPPADAMDVYVMGKQWMWKFSYPEGPSAVSTLRVPAHRPVRLLMTSRDVIHSFFVPDFRIKQDVLPNRYTQTWFTATKVGVHQILCTEFCGLNHSTMLGEVVVMEPEDYDRWIEEQKKNGHQAQDQAPVAMENVNPMGSMVAQGHRAAAVHGCYKCHTTDGTKHIGPSFKGMYLKEETLITGETIVADEGYLTRSMMDPMVQVVTGYDPVMPSFQGQLSGAESAALVELIKALSSNTTPALETPTRTLQ